MNQALSLNGMLILSKLHIITVWLHFTINKKCFRVKFGMTVSMFNNLYIQYNIQQHTCYKR